MWHHTPVFCFQFPAEHVVWLGTRRAVHYFSRVTHVLLILNINYEHHCFVRVFVMTLYWLQAFLLIKALLLKHSN